MKCKSRSYQGKHQYYKESIKLALGAQNPLGFESGGMPECAK